MQIQTSHLWHLRLVTFALAALTTASALFWGLKWQNPSNAPVAAPIVSPPRAIDSVQVAALLGARPKVANAPVNPLNNYKLLGVIAQGSRSGSALIVADGAPAKPFRVGDSVSGDLRLLSVSARSVTLGTGAPGEVGATLSLPPLPGTQ